MVGRDAVDHLRRLAVPGRQIDADLDVGPFRFEVHRLTQVVEQTAAFGHFGRTEDTFTWEKTDQSEALREAAQLTAAAR